MAGRPYRYSLKDIREWRVKASNLANNPRLSPGGISRVIAREYGVPVGVVRYYAFATRQDPKRYHQLYDLRYKHLIRRLDIILPALYNGNPELSLPAMSERIEARAGIKMQEGTLEKLLGKYNGERGPPVLKTESGSYKLNPSYYPSSPNAPAYQGNGVSHEDQTRHA